MRPSARSPGDLRALRITRNFTRHAEGAVLIEFGDTRVLCTASVIERQPPHLKGTSRGWVTADSTGSLYRRTGSTACFHPFPCKWGASEI